MAGDPWCESGPRDTSLVAVYWSMHCCWIFNITLGCYGSYRLFTNKRIQVRTFKILYICISICFMMAAPGFAFGIQAGWECWFNAFRPWEAIYMVGLAGYAYGLALLCLFFMLRAQKVFRNTKLRLNKCTKILFIIGLSIQLLTPIGFIFYFLSGWDEYNRTWALRYFNIFTWTNVCSSIGVLIVFIRRILALSKVDNDISQETNTEIDIEKEMKKITTDTQDIEKDLLRMIIRYSVCAIIALFSTLVVVFFGIIRSEVPSFHSDLTMRGLHLGFHVLDCTINLICLSLQFPFGKTMYGKCCGRIDLCVSNCFLKALRLKIKTSEDPVRTNTTTRVDSKTEVSV